MTTHAGFHPQPNSRWRYVGKPPGRGEIHRVCISDVHEVVTWSDPTADEKTGGHSWSGDAEEFARDFGPLG